MRPRLVLGILAVLLLGSGVAAWRYAGETKAAVSTTPDMGPAIPVTFGVAETKDVPVYITALGTVQAYNTVTVKVRVDGQLTKVAFTEGQNVKEGDLLAQIDPRPFQATLDSAVATKAKDQAQLDNARLDLVRFRTAGILANTQQQIDTQAALVRQLEATVQTDQANVEAAQVQLDYTTIKAPITGRTGIRLVDQGNIVHATDTTGLVVLTQLQPISVIFTLPQDQLHDVTTQMKASPTPLQVTAQGRDGRQLGVGTLALVDNMIDVTSGSVKLKATFPNKDDALWPGQYVSIQLLVQTLPHVVTVPSTAIQRGPTGYYVYVVKPDSTIAMQPVAVTQMAGGTAVVKTGLDAGTRIVSAGQYRLQPNSRVESAVKADATPKDVKP